MCFSLSGAKEEYESVFWASTELARPDQCLQGLSASLLEWCHSSISLSFLAQLLLLTLSCPWGRKQNDSIVVAKPKVKGQERLEVSWDPHCVFSCRLGVFVWDCCCCLWKQKAAGYLLQGGKCPVASFHIQAPPDKLHLLLWPLTLCPLMTRGFLEGHLRSKLCPCPSVPVKLCISSPCS